MRDVSVRMTYASKAAVCKRDMLRRCYVSGYVKQYATSVVYEDAEECIEGALRREGALIFSLYLLRWVGWITARYGGRKAVLSASPHRYKGRCFFAIKVEVSLYHNTGNCNMNITELAT
jgi:hypothetical protein